MLINVKMPTIVGILIFMSRINLVLSWVEHGKSFLTMGNGLYPLNISIPHTRKTLLFSMLFFQLSTMVWMAASQFIIYMYMCWEEDRWIGLQDESKQMNLFSCHRFEDNLLWATSTLCLLGKIHAFLVCWFFSKSTFSKNPFRNTIKVLNSLDSDQVRHFVGSGLDPNCLQRLLAVYTSKQRFKH